MAWIATVIGTQAVTGYTGAQAAKSAAETQAGAARDASAQQLEAAKIAAQTSKETTAMTLEQQQKMYDANVARMAPFVAPGAGALAQLQSGMEPGGQFMRKFNETGDFTQDPSYQWRLQQGQKALQASAAAKGTLMTGQGLADISNYAQNAASQEYQAAYGRYQDQQNTLFNRLNTLAGNSQNAAAGLGSMGTQVASNMGNVAMQGAAAQNQAMLGGAAASGNYLTSAAAAQAAGKVGQANAWSNAAGQGINTWMSLQYLNKLGGTPPVTPSVPDLGPA